MWTIEFWCGLQQQGTAWHGRWYDWVMLSASVSNRAVSVCYDICLFCHLTSPSQTCPNPPTTNTLCLPGANVMLTDVAEVMPLLRRNYDNNLSHAALRCELKWWGHWRGGGGWGNRQGRLEVGGTLRVEMMQLMTI